MSNLTNNTQNLQRVLESLQGKAAGGGGGNDSVIGTWVFNDELTPIGIEPDERGDRYLNLYFDYEVYIPEAGSSVKMDNLYISEWVDDEDDLIFTVSYYNENDAPYWFFDEGYNGYIWLAEAFKKINILTEPTDETFIAWLKANATKEIPTSISDISIEGTWIFNDEIILPEELFGEIQLAFSVFLPYPVSKTSRMEYLSFGASSLGYMGYQDVTFDDAYVMGSGWESDELRTIVIHEEWVDPQLIEWLRENAKKVGKPLVLNVTEQWDIPYWSCAEGSVAILKSDSLVGKWEWKDTSIPLDLSMFDLDSHYGEYIDVRSYDEFTGSVYRDFTFDTNHGEIAIYLGEMLLYLGNQFDDQYSTFDIYTDAKYFSDTPNAHITIEKFKEFIKANCNRLSGGNSLYIKEDGDWKYKCELAY